MAEILSENGDEVTSELQWLDVRASQTESWGIRFQEAGFDSLALLKLLIGI